MTADEIAPLAKAGSLLPAFDLHSQCRFKDVPRQHALALRMNVDESLHARLESLALAGTHPPVGALTGLVLAEVNRHLTAAMIEGDTLLRETKRHQLAI